MDVTLPNLGEGAESGTVVSILVKEGDQITKGQTILELENEKAVAPIPSPVSGTVQQIRVKEGDKIAVGHVVLTTSDGAARPKEAKAQPQPTRKPVEEAPLPAEQPGEQAQEEQPAPTGVAPAAA